MEQLGWRFMSVGLAAVLLSGLAGAAAGDAVSDEISIFIDIDVLEGGGGEGGGGTLSSVTSLAIEGGDNFNQTVGWDTPNDTNYYGSMVSPTSILIEMGTTNPGSDPNGWMNSSTLSQPVPGVPVPQAGQHQTVSVGGLIQNTNYYYVAKVTWSNGGSSGVSNIASGMTTADLSAPDPVTNLASVSVTYEGATLMWTAKSDDNSGPGALQACQLYQVKVSKNPITTDAEFAAATEVTGFGTPLSPGSLEVAKLTGFAENTQYHMMVEVRDDANNWSVMGNQMTFTTLINDHESAAAGDGCSGTTGEQPAWMLASAAMAAALLALRRA